jgi:rod shape-determining protein MreB and related proteins
MAASRRPTGLSPRAELQYARDLPGDVFAGPYDASRAHERPPVNAELALDLGTAWTRIADASGALVVEEPTVAATDRDSGRVVAFGAAALGHGARASGRVRIRRPVRNGQLVDIDLVEAFLAEALRRAGVSRLSRPNVLVCTHVGATKVQNRALERAIRRAGAKGVLFLAQPTAGAIGAGLSIDEPTGSMVADVGAGMTDIGVLALGGLVAAASFGRGADDFDDAIRTYLARERGVLVDPATAESIRVEIGSVSPNTSGAQIEVVGRDAKTARQTRAVAEASEIRPILEELVAPILDAVVTVITEAPPELVNDLLSSGVLLAGGGALLPGLDERLAKVTGVPVHVAADGGRAAVLGAARCLEIADGLSYAVSVARAR